MHKTPTQYFNLCDKDQDKLVNFTDFIGPILATIPPEVAMCFVSDFRFKIDCYSKIREARHYCSKITAFVTPDLVRGRIAEANDDLSQFRLTEFDRLGLDP